MRRGRFRTVVSNGVLSSQRWVHEPNEAKREPEANTQLTQWVSALHLEVTLTANTAAYFYALQEKTQDTRAAMHLLEVIALEKKSTSRLCASHLHWIVSHTIESKRADDGLFVGAKATSALLKICVLIKNVALAVEVLQLSSLPQGVPVGILEAVMELNYAKKEDMLQHAVAVEAFVGSPTVPMYCMLLRIAVEANAPEVVVRLLDRVVGFSLPLPQKITEEALLMLARHKYDKEASRLLSIMAHVWGLTQGGRKIAKDFGVQERLLPISEMLPQQGVVNYKEIKFVLSPLNPNKLTDAMVAGSLRVFTTEIRKIKGKPQTEQTNRDITDVEQEAQAFFTKAQEYECTTSTLSYREIVFICRLTDNYIDALRYYEEAKQAGVLCSKLICSAITSMVSKGASRAALCVFKEYQKTDLPPDRLIYETTLHVCQKGRDWDGAEYLIKQYERKKLPYGTNTYIALMNLCDEMDKWGLACELWVRYIKECRKWFNLAPSSQTFVCGFSKHVCFPYVRLMVKAGRWDAVSEFLHLFEKNLAARNEKNPRFGKSSNFFSQREIQKVLENVIFLCVKQDEFEVVKRIYRMFLRFSVSIAGVTLRSVLDMSLKHSDFLLASRLFQQFNAVGNAKETAFIVSQSLRSASQNIFVDAQKTLRLLYTAIEDPKVSHKAARLLDERLTAIMRFLVHCSYSMAQRQLLSLEHAVQFLRCLTITRFCREKSHVTKNEVILTTFTKRVSRNTPALFFKGVFLIEITVVWGLDSFTKFLNANACSRNTSPEIEPHETISALLTYFRDTPLAEIHHSVPDLVHVLSSTFTLMLQEKCRDPESNGRETWLTVVLTSICELERLGSRSNPAPEDTSQAHPTTELRELLLAARSLGVTQLSSPKKPAVDKAKGAKGGKDDNVAKLDADADEWSLLAMQSASLYDSNASEARIRTWKMEGASGEGVVRTVLEYLVCRDIFCDKTKVFSCLSLMLHSYPEVVFYFWLNQISTFADCRP